MSGGMQIKALESDFFAAFERGDSAAIAKCYSPDVRIWNNVQQTELTGPDHIAMLEAQFFPLYSNRKFINVRTDLIEGGFVRQHVVTGSVQGAPVRIPMCIICRVRNGLLTRIDEYVSFAAPPAT